MDLKYGCSRFMETPLVTMFLSARTAGPAQRLRGTALLEALLEGIPSGAPAPWSRNKAALRFQVFLAWWETAES